MIRGQPWRNCRIFSSRQDDVRRNDCLAPAIDGAIQLYREMSLDGYFRHRHGRPQFLRRSSTELEESRVNWASLGMKAKIRLKKL